jgi:hypothetical protein
VFGNPSETVFLRTRELAPTMTLRDAEQHPIRIVAFCSESRRHWRKVV